MHLVERYHSFLPPPLATVGKAPPVLMYGIALVFRSVDQYRRGKPYILGGAGVLSGRLAEGRGGGRPRMKKKTHGAGVLERVL